MRVVLVTQSCLTLCSPTDCGPPGSSVHGILQARILEWVATPFSRGSSRPSGIKSRSLSGPPRHITFCKVWLQEIMRNPETEAIYKIKSEMLSEANTRIQRSANLPTSSSSPGSAVTGNRSPQPPISPESPPVSDANQSRYLAPQGQAPTLQPWGDAVPPASPAPPLDCGAQPHGAPRAPFTEV